MTRNYKNPLANRQLSTPDSTDFKDIIDLMHKYAGRDITETEATEAARNLIGFYRTALAIRRRISQNTAHEQPQR